MLLLWAVGGLCFTGLTRRYDYVGAGYGWLGYSVWGGLAALAAALGVVGGDTVAVREAAGFALAGLSAAAVVLAGPRLRDKSQTRQLNQAVGLLIYAVGLVGLVAAGFDAASDLDVFWLTAVLRLVVGGLFLGAVSCAMLLGHWYLVQPGMSRQPLLELVALAGGLWVLDVVVWLLPTGMISVLAGSDATSGNSLLGWFWAVCAVATIGLLITTRLALKEPRYAAVMAATGLTYLAIMTAFGQELVARAGLFG